MGHDPGDSAVHHPQWAAAMLTWPERQAQQGWLHTHRRPPGDDVSGVLSPSTYYRVPMTKSSHKPRPDQPHVAWCGFPLQVDPDWWAESGWEAVWGPWYTIPEQRKTGICSQCATKSKAAPLPPRPKEGVVSAQEFVAVYGAKWEWERRKFVRKVYEMAGLFNGEVVE